ncbi:hypothetical protein EDB83DRAFT_2676323 [Lactarius deliciosus]|nr:hypothetical protein EDB83DRAFT_2676323 [Lactarius deliciosus]
MGVTGLWDILRPSGKLRSLTHVAVVDGFEANPANLRGLRIGIDASIWFFHAAHGREGENPELRTLFFRCAKLTSTPFLPLFIFDGPKRPKVKRGKRISGEKHWLVDSMKGMIEAFGFEWRMAPGEAEAELAYLNSTGIIDAVLSDDVDNFLFGAEVVIRNSSANLSGNSKHATKNADGRVDGNHSTVYTSADILAHPSVQLTRGGLILIGLLSGGDYHPAGLARCGTGIAHGLAKCGFGDELLKATQSLARDELPGFLTTWREDMRSELRTNSRGHLGSKKPSLAKAVPDAFPDIDVLLSYTNPIISATDAGARRTHTPPRWEREPDLGKLAHLCELHFEWGLKDIIIKRFRTVLWPSIVLRALRRSALEAGAAAAPGVREKEPLQDVFGTPSKLLARHFSSVGLGARDTGGDGDGGGLQELIVRIHGSRTHAYTDNILEYRLEVAPAQLVQLASAGIQGLRKPADTTYDVLPSESEESGGDPDDGDTGRRKKKRGAGPPPEPDSHLRVWMPACMVCPALPDLVERYEAEVEAKRAKKSSKGKQRRVPATKTSKKKAAKPRAPVDSDAEEFDLNVSCPSEDEEEGGGGSSPLPRTRTKAALPAASLDHSQSVRKYPTFSSLGDAQEQILDITTSDDEAAPDPSTKLPLSSPCKVLQTLDMNLNSDMNLCAPPTASSSPSASKRPPLRPFPMAFEEEESSEDDGGASNYYPLQTPSTAFRASTPPPPPRHQLPPIIPQEEDISSDDDPDMVIADLPVLADTRHLSPGREQPRAYTQTTTSVGYDGQQQRVSSPQTSPRRRPSRHHPFPPPPAKEARKGGLEEGRIPRAQWGGAGAETSIISISSGGSDSDDDDGLALAPLLIARSRTLVPQKVAATGRDVDREVIDLT